MAGEDTVAEGKFFDMEFFLQAKTKLSRLIQVTEGLFKLVLVIQQVVQVKKGNIEPRARI